MLEIIKNARQIPVRNYMDITGHILGKMKGLVASQII